MNSDNTMYTLLEEAKRKAMKEIMKKCKNNSVIIIDENKNKQE